MFEKLEATSFTKDFYEKMEEISYARYIYGEKYKQPVLDHDQAK
jgi:hypothetical protein